MTVFKERWRSLGQSLRHNTVSWAVNHPRSGLSNKLPIPQYCLSNLARLVKCWCGHVSHNTPGHQHFRLISLLGEPDSTVTTGERMIPQRQCSPKKSQEHHCAGMSTLARICSGILRNWVFLLQRGEKKLSHH